MIFKYNIINTKIIYYLNFNYLKNIIYNIQIKILIYTNKYPPLNPQNSNTYIVCKGPLLLLTKQTEDRRRQNVKHLMTKPAKSPLRITIFLSTPLVSFKKILLSHQHTEHILNTKVFLFNAY